MKSTRNGAATATSPRLTEERFGWGRESVAHGLSERSAGPIDPRAKTSGNRGQKRSEDAHPRLAVEIRAIVEPRTQTDPELKSERRYTNMSAGEVREATSTCSSVPGKIMTPS